MRCGARRSSSSTHVPTLWGRLYTLGTYFMLGGGGLISGGPEGGRRPPEENFWSVQHFLAGMRPRTFAGNAYMCFLPVRTFVIGDVGGYHR